MFLLLQVLLVGDSDVGKQEILAGLDDGNTEWGSSYAASATGGAGTVIRHMRTLSIYSPPCSLSSFTLYLQLSKKLSS